MKTKKPRSRLQEIISAYNWTRYFATREVNVYLALNYLESKGQDRITAQCNKVNRELQTLQMILTHEFSQAIATEKIQRDKIQ